MTIHILLVAAGGAAGGIGRFWISDLIARRYGDAFPWGTLVVNVTGATIIGVLAAFMLVPESHEPHFARAWALFAAGVLGSYTTVSSFSLQTLALLHSGKVALALVNVLASTGLCVTGAAIGFFAGRAMMGL